MTPSRVHALARKAFGDVLVPRGFSCEGTDAATFHRRTASGVVHFVLVDVGAGATWYDVKVFASTPEIESGFDERFPDQLGIPFGSFCYLHPVTGVGPDQKRYPCKNEEAFESGFRFDVEPALELKALPFLDCLTDLKTLVPHIRHDFYLGCALWLIGQRNKAEEILGKETRRLSAIADPTGRVAGLLTHIARLQKS